MLTSLSMLKRQDYSLFLARAVNIFARHSRGVTIGNDD
jgi:hypothetical protein